MKTIVKCLGILALMICISCKQKKFTATAEERKDYNTAYEFMKNIRTHLNKKEIEPTLKQTLINAADDIVKAGDVDRLEKEMTYDYFKRGLEKARFLKMTLMKDQEPLSKEDFEKYEKKYLALQKKLNKLQPDHVKSKLQELGVDETAKNGMTFISEQIKKYDLKTFLEKTMVAPSQMEISLKNIEEIADLTNEKILQLQMEALGSGNATLK
jgi:hypothetical protein